VNILHRYSCLLICLLCFPAMHAQKRPNRQNYIRDSLALAKPPLAKPQIRVDNRQVYFKGQLIAMNGVDAGVLLKDRLRITIGYHWLNDKLDFYHKTVGETEIDRQIKLKYASLNTEFIYLSKRYYSFGVPLEFGFGENKLVYKNYVTGENYSAQQRGFIFITDFGLSASFKPLRWVSIKGCTGYRKTLIDGVKDFHFNGFFTSLGLNVDLNELYRDLRMFNLERRYKRGNNISNAVDIITD